MAYENLTPGIYEATLVDWSCRMAPKINQPLIDLKFEFEDPAGKSEQLNFQSFLFTREGLPNKKTITTLKTIGFKSKNPNDLNKTDDQMVDNIRRYQITVGKDKNDKYWQIDWVNNLGDASVGAGVVDKKAAAKSVEGFDFDAFTEAFAGGIEEKVSKKKVKNHAPGAEDDDEEIPF